ncbi:RNA polymerase sporulation sigma factor SigK [Sporolactobacillus spathodeae]|uniref:RNA polymerase sigma factor n=1 Tax=Sporolactobacillus spathodeae TaxID=1465502 RepID=A0ABS2Q6M2_9BACL|nr:RNA polymerase sporulation sigma factor SigK [Sporolactobacillus spathodeae]MBM7657373.1 RNA polymerase sporulation-specific sigma factor [Sporolactobacillus spathodeae]
MLSIIGGLSYLFKQVLLLVSYVKNNAFPQPLSEDEERDCLERMANGDQEARDKLIEHNLRLVAHIVKKFENTKEDSDDLISIGTIGLIKAIENYSTGRGTKLATFAARCIENEILMHFRSLKKTRKDVSLNDPIGQDKEGNAIALIDILKSKNRDIGDEISLTEDINKIRDALDVLDHRETEVIIDRFGLNDQEELTQREIAKKLAISRSYVSRIEKRALMKIYNELRRKSGL